MHSEKFQFNQIKNGRLSAIIHFYMFDIWQTVPDSWTITIKLKFKMADLQPLLTLIRTHDNLSYTCHSILVISSMCGKILF